MTGVVRDGLAASFLASCGWSAAIRTPLAGDASARRYERLLLGDKRAVLMDAPPGQADAVEDFLAIGGHLARIGLCPPATFAQDIPHGFLLLEDLGDDLFARVLTRDPALEAPLYRAATDVLVHLQSCAPPAGLPDLQAKDWAEAAALAVDCYAPGSTGQQRDTLVAGLTDVLERHANGPRVLILRDYHAENLLWLPGREGLRKVGLLDFQLAQMGQPAYDLVSLLQDARRDVSEATEHQMIRHFAAETGTEESRLSAAYAVLGTQRALRILGIFSRLARDKGKPGYLALIPRVWGQLQRNLSHPALLGLRGICADTLPEPTVAHLRRLEQP